MQDIIQPETHNPEAVTVREREDGMAAYMMMFAALAVGVPFPMLNLVAAAVYWYLHKDSASAFVRFHSMQAFIGQLPTSLMNITAVAWSLNLLLEGHGVAPALYFSYLLATVCMNLLLFANCIVAAVKARRGQLHFMLVFGQLAWRNAYLRPGQSSTLTAAQL